MLGELTSPVFRRPSNYNPRGKYSPVYLTDSGWDEIRLDQDQSRALTLQRDHVLVFQRHARYKGLPGFRWPDSTWKRLAEAEEQGEREDEGQANLQGAVGVNKTYIDRDECKRHALLHPDHAMLKEFFRQLNLPIDIDRQVNGESMESGPNAFAN